MMLEEEELNGVPVMILANKQDLVDAMNDKEVTESLGLTEIKDRQWAIFKCSALTGYGLSEGMEWLVSTLQD